MILWESSKATDSCWRTPDLYEWFSELSLIWNSCYLSIYRYIYSSPKVMLCFDQRWSAQSRNIHLDHVSLCSSVILLSTQQFLYLSNTWNPWVDMDAFRATKFSMNKDIFTHCDWKKDTRYRKHFRWSSLQETKGTFIMCYTEPGTEKFGLIASSS